MEVQRLFEGAKKKNVEPYARYIVQVHNGQNGMAPPIVLYTQDSLSVDDDGLSIQVPWTAQLVAIDGETQLAARFEAAGIDSATEKEFVPLLICHGHPLVWARQVFHDLNLLAVRPNAALGLAMDNRDPITRVVREVEENVPFFTGRVHKARRQLRKSDPEVVTMTALRTACVTLAKGIGGVQYGTRPVSMEKDMIEHLRVVAVDWFGLVAKHFGDAIQNRIQSVASSSSAMAAIGALGNPLVAVHAQAARIKLGGERIALIRDVRWEKGKHWEGIAGKYTPKGKFSIAGAKDTAYALHAALTDPTSQGFARIRTDARRTPSDSPQPELVGAS